MSANILLEDAVRLHQNGRLDDAERAYAELLRTDPRNADALHLQGLIAHQRGDNERAVALIESALALAPLHHTARFNLANVLSVNGRTDDAIEHYERVVAHLPAHLDAWVNLANAYLAAGRHDDALSSYDRALALDAHFEPALANSLNARLTIADRQRAQGDLETALATCRRALAIRETAKGQIVLGQILEQQGALEASLAAYHRALSLDGDSVEAYLNIGGHYYLTGDSPRSVDSLRQAVEKQPNHVASHFALGIACLLDGRYHEGWNEFEWRRRDAKKAGEFRYEHVREWNGEPHPARLLISNEQGAGDIIFLARYLSDVASRADETIVEAPPELASLLCDIPGITVHAYDTETISLRPDDRQIPFFSLPKVFATDRAWAPSAPYLRAAPEDIARWRERLQLREGVRNVGIVWAGGDAHRLDRFRSARPADFAPLLEIENIRLLSLQKGPGASRFAGSPLDGRVEPLGAHLRDYRDTAAVVSLLDLVITVDTSVAHLAGALGRPVWMVLGPGTDWRWGTGGTRTSWYPTMRLFRTRTPFVWDGAMAEVTAALDAL